MRIALVSPLPGPRTGSRTYAMQLRGILATRHEVVVADPRAPFPPADLVHVADAKSVLGRPFRDERLVVDLHDDYWTGAPAYPAFDAPLRTLRRARLRPRYLAILERADAVVVHARHLRNAVPHDRTVVVPLPAERPPKREVRGDGGPVRTPVHAPPGSNAPEGGAGLDVLFAGRDALRKGLPVLGDALRRVPDLRPRLRVAGGDWMHLRLAARWWLRGLGASFEGDLSERAMEEAYRRADLVALPSYTEAFGLVAQEALLRGVPVVAGRVGGLVELIEEAGGGILVPPGDADGLAAAIRAVAGDLAAWRGRAAEAGDRIAATRGPQATLDALERAYALALGEVPREAAR